MIAGALFAGTAGPALADVCGELRGGWVAGAAPVGFWQEAWASLYTVPGLAVVCFGIAALVVRSLWMSLAGAALGLGLAALLWWDSSDAAMQAAMAEGCIGPAGGAILPFALVGLVLLAQVARMILGTRRRG